MPIDRETLLSYADELNGQRFSNHFGWEWFVNNRKHDDGGRTYFLDRRDRQHAPRPKLKLDEPVQDAMDNGW